MLRQDFPQPNTLARVLAESFPSREAKKRHKSDGAIKSRYFLPQSSKTKPSLLKMRLWVEQAWLCDTGAELMNVEGFCRERMQSKVRQPKAKAALVNVVVMRPKDRPQHHS